MRCTWAMLLGVAGACFAPTYHNPSCGPGDTCPPGLVCLVTTCVANANDAIPADTVDSPSADAMFACDLTKPFGTPVLVTGLPTGGGDVTLTPDELTVFFEAPGPALSDIFRATRTSPDAAFGAASLVASTTNYDYQPSLSADQLSLYFHADIGNNPDLYVATRGSISGSFGTPTALAGFTGTSRDYEPFITELSLYFINDALDGLNGEVWRVPRIGGGFGTREKVSSIDTGSSESNVVVAENELTIYWASDRAGGVGGVDIWRATRISTIGPWTNITNVTTVNSPGTDAPSYVTRDDCRLYLSSAGRTYVATRPR